GNGVYKGPGRGHLQRFQALVCKAAKNPKHVQVRVLPLRRTHAERGIALEQFEVVESFLNRVLDILELNVFVQIEEVLPFKMREDRIGMTARRTIAWWTIGGISSQPDAAVSRCLSPRAEAIFHLLLEAENSIDAPGSEQSRRQFLRPILLQRAAIPHEHS